MPYKYIDIERKLKKLWFYISRQNWSHVVFLKDNKTIIVPKHWSKEISIWVEKTIIKNLWLDDIEFKRL